jgi:hypothetical protein
MPQNQFNEELYGRSNRPAVQGQFQSLFEVAAARLGMGREFKAIKVCHDAGKILETLLPGFAGQYRVSTFRDGILTVSSNNPALLQKLQMQSHHLLEELKRISGENIERIRMKNS